MASVDESSRPRRRVTYIQLETLWEFLNSHKEVAIGYNKSAHAREYSKRMWESVTDALNSHGDGAIKDCKGWSNYWIDYKAKLKKRVAAVRASLNRTGGGPSAVPPLNDIEKKFLALLGSGYGTSLPNIQVPIPFLTTSSAGENVIIESDTPLLGSEPIANPHLPEEPSVVNDDPQLPQEASQSQVANSNIREASSRPVRQRRRRDDHISQETARRTLIQISRSRLDVETKNSQTLLKMLDALNKIAEKIDRFVLNKSLLCYNVQS